MVRACGLAMAMVLSGSAGAAGEEPALVIEHRPLRCVVALSHPWIQARATGAVTVLARFRRSNSRDWYAVRLADEEEGWSGALPRPDAYIETFVYFLEATDAATRTSKTPVHTVRVVAMESACGADGVGPSVPEATVATEAPRGRPPLPKGFGSGEVEATGSKVGMFDLSARTSVLAALGVGAAAVGVALAVAKPSDSPSQEVEFVSSSPPPGSTISLTGLALSVRLRIRSETAIAPGSVVIDMRSPTSPIGCVTLWSAHGGIAKGSSIQIQVDRVLFVTCPAPFTVPELTVEVRGPRETAVFGASLPASYSFVP